jgi:hypothetical protein
MILLFDSAAVNSTPAAIISHEARPFGHGIIRRPFCPTLTELAFESGRTIGLEAEHEVEPPAHFSAADRSAFRSGLAEAFMVLSAREADHLAELAENDADLDAVCRGFVPL